MANDEDMEQQIVRRLVAYAVQHHFEINRRARAEYYANAVFRAMTQTMQIVLTQAAFDMSENGVPLIDITKIVGSTLHSLVSDACIEKADSMARDAQTIPTVVIRPEDC